MCQLSGARIGPTQIHAFRQHNNSAALAGCIANECFGSVEIGGRLTSHDNHLHHANSVCQHCRSPGFATVRRLAIDNVSGTDVPVGEMPAIAETCDDYDYNRVGCIRHVPFCDLLLPMNA
jgi:hypothetical protein